MDDSNPGNKMCFKRMNLSLPPKSVCVVTSLTINPPKRFSFFFYRIEFRFLLHGYLSINTTSKTTILRVKSARFQPYVRFTSNFRTLLNTM